MSKLIRLDKYLADMGIGTRTEVKQYIKKGRVVVDGRIMKGPEQKIDLEQMVVLVDGQPIQYEQYEYYMLHKPAGVVSATEDAKCQTVVDLIKTAKRKDLFPVGRLDKDTEGLLLITNDGNLSHKLLSPKKHVPKVYYAKIDGRVTEADVELFAKGLHISDDFIALPAKLNILVSDEQSEITLCIVEGKFHQVKRMFEAVGKKVTYLKRLSMGSLHLDESLAVGEYRALNEEELCQLRQCNSR